MVEINNSGPYKIIDTRKHTITLDLNSTGFGDYTKQGVVENKKVPKKMSFHPWSKSFHDPVGSSPDGMLAVPDLAKFGRGEQLHAALYGIYGFVKANSRYPDDKEEDVKACLGFAQEMVKASEFEIEIEEPVFKNAVRWAGCSISPMSAFFGGIIA